MSQVDVKDFLGAGGQGSGAGRRTISDARYDDGDKVMEMDRQY
jgi:hypothetical protein